jgi:hypothetical protein
VQANASVLSVEANRDFMAVRKRLITQQNQIVLSAIVFCTLYALIAARVIPLTYWLIAAIFLSDGIQTFFFTATNIRFSARRRKDVSNDEPRPESFMSGTQIKVNNTMTTGLRSTTAKDSSTADNSAIISSEQ